MWSNTATASASSWGSRAPSSSVRSPSTMLGSISNTCCARFRHAAARGSVSTTICAIITKNRIRIAYSSTAEILAICMAWAPTRLPPTHSTATSAMFIKKKLELSRPTNRWLTLMALAAYSLNTSSRRRSSWRSLLNARMTRTPTIFSRSTTFMRSIKPCRRIKIGAALATVKTAATSTIATTTPRSVPMAGSINQAKMMPATAKNGTGSTS